MNVSKQISLAVTATTAMIMAVVAFMASSGLSRDREEVVLMGLAVVCGALVVGWLTWLMIVSFVEHETQRLVRHTRQAAESDEPVDLFKPVPWMTELAETIDDTVMRLRSRIDHLSVRRRDLEVEARLAQNDRRYGLGILNALEDAVIVTDAFNELAMVNRAAARLFGFDPEQVIGRPVGEALGDPLMAQLVEDTRRGSDSEPPRCLEHRAGHGANARSCSILLRPVTNDQGERCGVVVLFRSARHPSVSEDMSREFVSGVSHELRTPLSSIHAYIEMLVDGEAPDEATRQEFYNIIQSETNRLSRLVDNILHISRIESGVAQAQREEVPLLRLVRDVVDVMMPQARAAQVTLSENAAPQRINLVGDRDLLYQALLNLVSNAIKYTRPGGRVTVETTVDEEDRWVEIAVTDTGVGVPVEDQSRLFEKFYRVDSHKKYAKGSGLGLNLVRHVVETLHQGHISLTSRQGSGSAFRVRLPLAEAASDACVQPQNHGVPV